MVSGCLSSKSPFPEWLSRISPPGKTLSDLYLGRECHALPTPKQDSRSNNCGVRCQALLKVLGLRCVWLGVG